MSTRLRDYEKLVVDGLNPLEAYRAIRNTGKQRLECVRDIRQVFNLELGEAKEVMVICEGEASSLHEYQGNIAQWLESAVSEMEQETEQ